MKVKTLDSRAAVSRVLKPAWYTRDQSLRKPLSKYSCNYSSANYIPIYRILHCLGHTP